MFFDNMTAEYKIPSLHRIVPWRTHIEQGFLVLTSDILVKHNVTPMQRFINFIGHIALPLLVFPKKDVCGCNQMDIPRSMA